LRSFVAIDLPEALRKALAEKSSILSSAIAPRAIRWVRLGGIHLTLKFLGDVNPTEMQSVHQVILETVPRFSPFSFSVGGFGCFPNIRRPRVIWVGVQERSGEMAALYEELEKAFAARGFEREKRRFHPHLTLGRVRRGVGQAERRVVGEVIGRVEDSSLGHVNVKEICLFRSELKPSGAVYTRLLAAQLEGRT
jgi:2'-5' RNA ligase